MHYEILITDTITIVTVLSRGKKHVFIIISYLFLKKLRLTSLARGINCDRLVRMPVICKSLYVSSRITARLRVRRRLHESGPIGASDLT